MSWQDVYAEAAHDAIVAASKALQAVTPQERFEAALRRFLNGGASFAEVELCVRREALIRKGKIYDPSIPRLDAVTLCNATVVGPAATPLWNPTHYTSWEGDVWRVWPAELDKDCKKRCLSIHSIRFDNGAEFDILNGWRWPVAPGSVAEIEGGQ